MKKLTKTEFYEKRDSKLIFFNKKNMKIRMIFDIGNWIWMSKSHDFWCHCAFSALQISKKHFAMFNFFVKIKLVSTVVHINATILTWFLIVCELGKITSFWPDLRLNNMPIYPFQSNHKIFQHHQLQFSKLYILSTIKT